MPSLSPEVTDQAERKSPEHRNKNQITHLNPIRMI